MIFVECKPDRLLVSILVGIGRKEIKHSGSKFEVMKKLDKYSMALGIIDEDHGKNQPIQLQKAEDISTSSIRASDLILLRYRGNLVLVLRPRLEEWILKTAREININPQDFSLPNDPEQLHGIINYNLDKFKRLLIQMKYYEQKSGRIETLKGSVKNYKQILLDSY